MRSASFFATVPRPQLVISRFIRREKPEPRKSSFSTASTRGQCSHCVVQNPVDLCVDDRPQAHHQRGAERAVAGLSAGPLHPCRLGRRAFGDRLDLVAKVPAQQIAVIAGKERKHTEVQ
ncbi:hypothetical protein HAT86_11380 [Roseovarius gahaiensis]|uniref:Uncharacterized protein n=1 Tax=Roseovarius gahaiensis TaxID=2716691 RepID=A0A967BEY2_9RHOB|nr:hypothetical protein [Roseovarius gahaiensis]